MTLIMMSEFVCLYGTGWWEQVSEGIFGWGSSGMIFVLPLLLYFALIFSRLHGHAIFGVMSVSDTCWTLERVRLSGFRCPASVLFFFFFNVSPTRLRRVRHASSEEKKKWKSQILSSEKSFWETHLSSSQPTLPLTSAAALCPSLELDQADRRAP